MEINCTDFAEEWIASWNAHDLKRILSHYSDDFEITTPMIKVALGIDTGTLKGKVEIEKYWHAAFQKVPDLNFELLEVTESVNSIAIYYKSVFEKRAIEIMFFNQNNKVNRAIAHYS